MTDAIKTIKSLPIWHGEIGIKPLSGGLTNANYLVSDQRGEFVVRMGGDIVEHHVMRFNELAASKAAHAAGLSPKVLFSKPGILVMDYINSKTFSEQDMRQPENLAPLAELLKTCHHKIPEYLRGPSLVFSVFQVIRDYGWTLREGRSSHLHLLEAMGEKAALLESAQGPAKLVFGHNDLVAANILDDGKRLWLIDWDYAGFNTPLFDLANLASNNGYSAVQGMQLLEAYFEQNIEDEIWYKFQAMKCASLLRETMWSMVSEIKSKIDHDFATYTRDNLERFNQAYDDFLDLDK